MKLLLDENLSRRMLPALQVFFPGSSHVALEGLERSSDQLIWGWAKSHGFTILTKDDDFSGLLAVFGHPPKIVLLKMGNSSNNEVVAVLSEQHESIKAALENPQIGQLSVC